MSTNAAHHFNTISTDFADRVIHVGQDVRYCGSVQEAHGIATVVAITEGVREPGRLWAPWVRFDLVVSGGTLRGVRPESISDDLAGC